MPGMSCSMMLSQELRLENRLRHEQKLCLELLLSQLQILKHPEFPNATKGLEGMRVAHKILLERNYVGVLFGGVAESVWNYRRTPEELAKHKDVDVIIINDNPQIEPFQGGIDWWTKETKRLTVTSDISRMQNLKQAYLKNANDVVLPFLLYQQYDLNAGLYIIRPDLIKRIKEIVVIANINTDSVDVSIDDEVLEKFNEKISRKIKTKVPKYIAKEFEGHILEYKYVRDYNQKYAIEIKEINTEIVRAIKREYQP
jgi:hypothetical protein